ncbi:MAG: riboflavin kinase, partial [Planctomycetia bacterium]
MLGRPYSLWGEVVHGDALGRELGFPTANLDPHHELLPPTGVYSAWIQLEAS